MATHSGSSIFLPSVGIPPYFLVYPSSVLFGSSPDYTIIIRHLQPRDLDRASTHLHYWQSLDSISHLATFPWFGWFYPILYTCGSPSNTLDPIVSLLQLEHLPTSTIGVDYLAMGTLLIDIYKLATTATLLASTCHLVPVHGWRTHIRQSHSLPHNELLSSGNSGLGGDTRGHVFSFGESYNTITTWIPEGYLDDLCQYFSTLPTWWRDHDTLILHLPSHSTSLDRIPATHC